MLNVPTTVLSLRPRVTWKKVGLPAASSSRAGLGTNSQTAQLPRASLPVLNHQVTWTSLSLRSAVPDIGTDQAVPPAQPGPDQPPRTLATGDPAGNAADDPEVAVSAQPLPARAVNWYDDAEVGFGAGLAGRFGTGSAVWPGATPMTGAPL